MQNPPTSNPQSTNPNRSSVPLYVYRELSAELQAAQAMLDSLNSHNQQLVKQNQQLRQEIEKVVQSHQHLQQVVATFKPVNGFGIAAPNPVSEALPPMPERPHVASVPVVETVAPTVPKSPKRVEPFNSGFSEPLVAEVAETRSRRPSPPERSSDVNGWLLIAAILLIVLTAFGTGFLIVRPLINNNNR